MNALTIIDDKARHRIISTAALLSSPQDGERLAASHGLDRLLAPHGIGVADVFRAALEPAHRAPPVSPPRYANSGGMRPVKPTNAHQRLAWLCLHQGDVINAWERQFLSSIMNARALTAKQQATLNGIVAKIDASLEEGQ
jgi:hypothetical protein